MLAFICFFITIVGNLNWLCIGFFQYDFIAGFFGTQSSIFSRLFYIIFGVASVFLTYAVIRYKGRLTIKKNKNQDQVLMVKQPVPDSVSNNENLIKYENNNQNINQDINNSKIMNSENNNTQN